MINDYEATDPITTDAKTVDTRDLSSDEIASKLNDLIQICKDGEEGFRTAAEGVDSPELKSFFNECSQQRAQFASELVSSLGGDPESSGSFSGAVHRGWMDLKAAIEGNDPKGVLNECERGEDYAKKAYREALENDRLPANIREVVQRQCDAVIATHDRVKILRDSASHEADNDGPAAASTSQTAY
jgi:uncharacterized protein (TIGR02284 family)